MSPNDQFIVCIGQSDENLRDEFRDKLREIYKLAEKIGSPTHSEPKLGGEVAFHEAAFPVTAYWRQKDRPLTLTYSVSHGTERPVVRLKVVDHQGGHTTCVVEMLRLDHANYLAPGCSADDVRQLLKLWWESTSKIARPNDFDPDETKPTLETTMDKFMADLAPLIHVYGDGDKVSPAALYHVQLCKPYALPNLAHTDYSGSENKLTPILGGPLAAMLSEQLPGFVTLAKKDTRRVLGYSFGAFTHGPFSVPASGGPVEDMIGLQPFAHLPSGNPFTPGVFTPALAA